MAWPVVKFAKILRRVERFEDRDDFKEYPFAGTYSFARGIFIGATKPGSSFALPRVQRIKKGDFVYCKIMVWEGAFGIVPDGADDCVLSGAFMVYEIDRSQIEPMFLEYFFKIARNWMSIGSQSTGTNVRRRSLDPRQFENSEIPLPPLAEQRRIIARIQELSAKIEEARNLRLQIESDSESLCRAILFDITNGSCVPTRMRELVMLKEADVVVDRTKFYQFAGVYCFGGGVFKGQLKAGSEFSYVRLTRLRTNDFVYPKLMAWEGAFGVVPASCDGFFVSPEFPVFEIDQGRVLPETLDIYFRAPSVWPRLAALSTGTNVRRRRLHPARFLEFEIPLPPMAAQQRLRAAKRKLLDLKPAQAEVAAELDALMPSVLSRAFSGGL